VPAGLRTSGMVSLRDLPATVMDLTTETGGVPFPGGSLARFWQGDSAGSDTLLVQTRYARGRPEWDATSRGDMQGALQGTKAFIRDMNSAAELFELQADPWQERNVAGEARLADTVASYHRYLDRIMGSPPRARKSNADALQ